MFKSGQNELFSKTLNLRLSGHIATISVNFLLDQLAMLCQNNIISLYVFATFFSAFSACFLTTSSESAKSIIISSFVKNFDFDMARRSLTLLYFQ